MMFKAVAGRMVRVCAWLLLSAMVAVVLSAGCSKSVEQADEAKKPRYEVADDSDAGSAGEANVGQPASNANLGSLNQPPSVSINQLESVKVPDGTPAELLEFVQQTSQKIMALQQNGSGDPAATEAQAGELFQAIIIAADKILAGSEANYDERMAAIQNKAGAMGYLSRLQPQANWSAKVREFATTLAADHDPAIAIEGKLILFGLRLGPFVQSGGQDLEGVVGQLRALLQEEARNGSVLQISIEAMNALVRLGHEEAGREVLDLIVAAYQDNPDASLVQETVRLREQALFLDAQMEAKFRAALEKRPEAEAAFLQELQQLLTQPNVGSLTLDRSAQFIGMLQQTGQLDLARKACDLVQQRYAEHPDADLKARAERITKMVIKRIDLVGQPLAVVGTKLDDTPLDFSQYQGKTVLVTFFSAFDQRCQQELNGIVDIYNKFHDRGFEVIGVSVDTDREQLKQILSGVQLPWVTVTNSEFVEQCGVDIVPLNVLIDASGTVTGIFVQLVDLSAKLEALP